MKNLQNLIVDHRSGTGVGIYSVCCSNADVLLASMDVARRFKTPLLIEATSNQVDQFGGYTGMTPAEFRDYVRTLAEQAGFPLENIILGGDHLGPNAWQHLPAEEAMARARDLIHAYVSAGFTKIHLDCSMSCAGDPSPLPDALAAERSACLAKAAETAAADAGLPGPVYVIGTEVPIPGGEVSLHAGLSVTRPEAAAATLSAHRHAFAAYHLDQAWERVIALVVQPGVDFDHSTIHHFNPTAAAALSAFVETQSCLVYEAHSTDYQTEQSLRALVRGHFAILKVGPAATFALREAWYALAAIEEQLVAVEERSHLPAVLERCMQSQPRHWQKHYAGNVDEQRLLRRFAFSDRCRYYLGEPPVQRALQRLCENLDRVAIPLTLISQFLPEQYEDVVQGRLSRNATALARHKVGLVLSRYARACAAESER